jgi:hypothetical protein
MPCLPGNGSGYGIAAMKPSRITNDLPAVVKEGFSCVFIILSHLKTAFKAGSSDGYQQTTLCVSLQFFNIS